MEQGDAKKKSYIWMYAILIIVFLPALPFIFGVTWGVITSMFQGAISGVSSKEVPADKRELEFACGNGYSFVVIGKFRFVEGNMFELGTPDHYSGSYSLYLESTSSPATPVALDYRSNFPSEAYIKSYLFVPDTLWKNEYDGHFRIDSRYISTTDFDTIAHCMYNHKGEIERTMLSYQFPDEMVSSHHIRPVSITLMGFTPSTSNLFTTGKDKIFTLF